MLCLAGVSVAEDLTIDEPVVAASVSIAELTRTGHHLEAVTAVKEKAEGRTLADILAGAKSAWALGMVATARELWDEALAHRDFKDAERTRTYLARAILELQEDNYDAARSFAEQGISQAEPSELRAQLTLVVAEALRSQGASSLAEGYYKRAADEGGVQTKSEALYLLGDTQLNLGRAEEARFSLVGVETSSRYTPLALRRLMEIDLTQKNFESVLTWVDEGRENYGADFDDGWTSYARVTALLGLSRNDQARDEVANYKIKHAEQDNWFLLAEAACEAHSADEALSEMTKQGTPTQQLSMNSMNKNTQGAKHE